MAARRLTTPSVCSAATEPGVGRAPQGRALAGEYFMARATAAVVGVEQFRGFEGVGMHGSQGASSRGRFCFVHASDLRLDVMLRGLPDAPESLRASIRDASLEAWHALIALAVDRRA